MIYPSIDRIAQLQQLIADFAKVKRVPHLADNGVEENDVEHSFGLALTCWFLHDKIAPELNLQKIFQYALAHDIVEIHAGDTFVFDSEAVRTKEAREHDALAQIKTEWPDFQGLTDGAEAYMKKIDEEARFVKAVDKLLPVLMIELGEKEIFWKKHKLTLEHERENKKTILVSDAIAPYYEKLIDWLDGRNNIPKN